MALSATVDLLNALPEVVLAGNKIPLRFQASTNLIETEGSKAEIILTWTDEAVADEYFDLLLKGTTVRFTCKAAPDNSGIQFRDNTLAGTLEEWVALMSEDLKKNYLIARYYDVVVVGAAITITAKTNGAEYSLEFITFPGIDVTVTESNKAGSSTSLRAFYGIAVLLYCNDEFVTELILNVDNNGIAEVDIADLLKSYLIQEFNWPDNEIDFMLERNEAIAEFYFCYGEKWGADEYKALSVSDTYFVLNGGVSRMMQTLYNENNLSFWDLLKRNKHFLSWAPKVRYIGADELIKLYFLNHSGASELNLLARIYTDAGSSEVTLATVTGVVDKAIYELAFSTEKAAPDEIADESLTRVEVWIEDGNDVIISEIRTYYIDYSYYEHTRYFIFKNSLGFFEIIKSTGLLAKSEDYTREIAAVNTDADFDTKDIEEVSVSNSEQQKFTVALGWLNRYADADEYRNWLKDFSLSKEIYIISGSTIKPVRITSTNLDHGKDRDSLKGFVFEFVNAFRDDYFTKEVINRIGDAELPALTNIYDFILPCYIQNVERKNLNPPNETRWHITAIDAIAKTITVDQPLPEELSEVAGGVKKWFGYRLPGAWVLISEVNFETRTITYSEDRLPGSLGVGNHITWFCPFRSLTLNPTSIMISVTDWASLWVIPGPIWKHSDGTYRMVSVGYNSSYNTTTLYSSPDLINWTLVGASYKYRAGEAPFNKSWCVSAVNHNIYGPMAKITCGTYKGYFLGMVQGVNAGGIMQCGAVIFDENFNVIYIPDNPLVIPGYIPDASDKFNIGMGVIIYRGKYYVTISYRDITPGNLYTLLFCELSGPLDPTVVNIEVILAAQIPNCWMSLSAGGGPTFEYNGELYTLIAGENNSGNTTDTPLMANFECGIAKRNKNTGSWVIHPQSPLIMNPVSMTEIYPGTEWCADAMGTAGIFIEDGVLNIICAMKSGTDGYRIGRLYLNLIN